MPGDQIWPILFGISLFCNAALLLWRPVLRLLHREETVSEDNIMAMVEENSDEDEWFPLGDLGNLILKRYPDFDVRNFGFKKFTPFIKSLGVFEFKEERVPGSNNKLIYIREKQEKQDKEPQPAPVPVQTPDTAVSGTGLASFLERPTWSKKKLEL